MSADPQDRGNHFDQPLLFRYGSSGIAEAALLKPTFQHMELAKEYLEKIAVQLSTAKQLTRSSY